MTSSPLKIALLSIVLLLLPACVRAQELVTVTPDWSGTQIPIPSEFSGLSFETQLALAGSNGIHYFRADNAPLIQLFKTLGIKHLRIGGNTSDNPTVNVPVIADIDDLFAFAQAADLKVVYTVRLKGQTDASADIPIVKHILDHYAANLDCFALGNEPSVYYKQYPVYKEVWVKMSSQIVAAEPRAVFCGPNTDRHYEWAVDFANDFAHCGYLKEINEHAYVGLSARKVTDVVAARDKMLSNDWVKLYQGVYDAFVPQVLADKLPYRMEETNTFFNGGKEGASDTFTAALWALDYMYWWVGHNASGLNFHTGDKVAAGAESTPCRYAAYVSSSGGYDVHPVGYGIKAFDLGGHGSLLPVEAKSANNLNLTAYAVAAADGLYVTIVNKEHGISGRDATVQLNSGKSYAHGEIAFLANSSHDIAATTGTTLGGAAISEDGNWAGKWTDLPAPSQPGQFTVTVPAASAAIIKLSQP
jgi:hypothetical protein